ncbi:FHA domain-containing protein [Cetobacterium sp. 2A]|uniref:FHA domain-containing protein n=1 Tax=Cetobacterium sp. 2A TaxID=2754723 RepID=UPI00163BF9EC|nr:FHA domain-containing protein [Cetobacterium sp. 2A]MBC2857059.1 FHA domain-containing protein [Cetobacterium sp. 2A]
MKLERCENGHVYNSGRYKECPYCNSERLEDVEVREEAIDIIQNDEDKTVAYWANELDVEPVVGWVVCISGYDKGKDFKLKTEKNFIGRGPEMDICISGDNSITRKNHAVITYNPKQRVFMMLPGEGTGIVYVQNEAVYSPRQLNSFDVIEIGNSKFTFVALCGENFDWKIEK